MVASEQEGSVDSQESFKKTDQDLISYMLSSVLSLPQDEEDKKVKCMDYTNASTAEENDSHWVSKSKPNYSFSIIYTCVMAGFHGGSRDAEQPKEYWSETSPAQSPWWESEETPSASCEGVNTFTSLVIEIMLDSNTKMFESTHKCFIMCITLIVFQP